MPYNGQTDQSYVQDLEKIHTAPFCIKYAALTMTTVILCTSV